MQMLPVSDLKNPPNGVAVYYYLKAKPTSDVILKLTDSSGKLVREISSKPEPKEAPGLEEDERPIAPKPSAKAGLNRFVWDLRYADATRFRSKEPSERCGRVLLP